MPFIGEYGAYEGIPLDQRALYYRTITAAFASIGMPAAPGPIRTPSSCTATIGLDRTDRRPDFHAAAGRVGGLGMFSRRQILGAAAAAALLPASARAHAAQPIAADWQAFVAAYRVPDWFRDAKFGIWAHWGPQCVPEYGDWYGRQMYIQGNPFYDHHVRTYGHPAASASWR